MSVKFCLNFNHHSYSNNRPQIQRGGGLFLKGDNPDAVILIHGLTGTPQEMRYLANYLNKKGYTVSCPLLAKHGEHLEVLKKARWEEFYQSARAALEQLKDNRFVYTSGLSMGALLALLLAEEFPQKVKGASCLSPTLFYDGWNTPWYKFVLPLAMTFPLRNFLYFKEDYPYGIKNEIIRERVHRYYARVSLRDHDPEMVLRYGYPFFSGYTPQAAKASGEAPE